MASTSPNTALVLGGGSIKGAFEAGAIEVVLGHGFIPEAIYGVSTGALNAAYLAHHAGAMVQRIGGRD